nr:hypothetical protein [uncultured Kingella sp.]
MLFRQCYSGCLRSIVQTFQAAFGNEHGYLYLITNELSKGSLKTEHKTSTRMERQRLVAKPLISKQTTF